MSDLPHSLYTVISFAITAVLLVVFKKYITNEKHKKLVLTISALSTVILHYSSLYVDYFTTGEATVSSTMILAVYPCNVAMWFLVAVAYAKDIRSKFFNHLAEATFYLGLVGGVVGIVINENYIANPNLADWEILKGLLSHSTMIVGWIYLLTGGYIKIRVNNLISVTGMLLFLVLDGGIVIGLHKLFKLNPPNCMYLLENPVPALPWFNTWLIGVLGVLICFAITALYEQLALPKEERWYSKIKNLKTKEELL